MKASCDSRQAMIPAELLRELGPGWHESRQIRPSTSSMVRQAARLHPPSLLERLQRQRPRQQKSLAEEWGEQTTNQSSDG
ncbi:MAG: hypothetical protein M3220_15400 [Chloroflexota bacterium]|nr:hypothetical protein [Chloroflexota bacterium]